MSNLEKLRNYYDEWQHQGYDQRPIWYDDEIDHKINSLTNVELLELLEVLEDFKP